MIGGEMEIPWVRRENRDWTQEVTPSALLFIRVEPFKIAIRGG